MAFRTILYNFNLNRKLWNWNEWKWLNETIYKKTRFIDTDNHEWNSTENFSKWIPNISSSFVATRAIPLLVPRCQCRTTLMHSSCIVATNCVECASLFSVCMNFNYMIIWKPIYRVPKPFYAVVCILTDNSNYSKQFFKIHYKLFNMQTNSIANISCAIIWTVEHSVLYYLFTRFCSIWFFHIQ